VIPSFMTAIDLPEVPVKLALSDGRRVAVRLAHLQDAPLVQEMYASLSPRTLRLRYHAYTAELPLKTALTMCAFDSARNACLVAVHNSGGREYVIGHAQCARASSGAVEAETAIVVRDDFQGLGLGSRMLSMLLELCHSQNIKRVFGWVDSQNRHMLHLYRKTEWPLQIQHHAGAMLVTLFLSPTRAGRV
jgi:GNAT superfamily N-acetyltransferase